ncbi:MAG: DUF72 domain-containing protein [Acidobacteria bacterium]|nr:DUF72 domain-containing protein [Acidobacteriota bacterium]
MSDGSPGRQRPAIRVGTAGWSYADWEGIVYPRPAPAHFDRLAFVASFFDTVEINTFFYRLPELHQVESWARRVANRPRFRFAVKAWSPLTHGRSGINVEDAADQFVRRLQPLREAHLLGAVLLQFPYRFRPIDSSIRHLENLSKLLAGLPLVAEFRRASWDSGQRLEALAELGVAFCNIDQPPISGNLPPTAHATTRLGYVRLHGRNRDSWFNEEAGRDARYDYLYGKAELEEWVARIEELGARGAEEIFIIANNHYCGKAACNALELQRMLVDNNSRAPASLADAYPRLGPSGSSFQRRLF